ncbi:hypothetical protein [Roseateles sp. BYS96W]|uniref:Uncharacterized protein n=1 Tax=Pelomonas nitida TaxID=3299027 RepID=A0ABW7G8X8_9BURK
MNGQPYLHFDAPTISISDWAAFLLAVPGLGMPSIHVVGTNLLTRRSRVSSPVTLVHPSKLQVVTQSRRIYELVGARGPRARSLLALERLTATWNADVVGDITNWLFEEGNISTAGLAGRPRFFQ